MWSFEGLRSAGRLVRLCGTFLAVAGLGVISACTLEPLNAAKPDSAIVAGNAAGAAGVSSELAAIEIDAVNDRVTQQVRNALLFGLNGGKQQPGGKYRVKLTATSLARTIQVQANSRAPTSAQLEINAGYTLIEKASGTTVAFGSRTAVASYDRTPQSFANQRAQRDAENRAAKEVAEQLRLAIAQAVAAQ